MSGTQPSKKQQTFFLIAGEASGDLLGARLMQAIKKKTESSVRFLGVGGPRMLAEGMEPLFPQSDLAHMGLLELIRHLPNILKRIRQTIDAVLAAKPAALITIDSPDFCFRVAKKVKGHGIPLIHYVAPTVWAWRPKRAKKVAQFLDHLLTLLPFEPVYFTKEGLAATFVGHPLIESDADKGDGNRFRAKFGVRPETCILSLLPGSRMGEVTRLLPIFRETVIKLREKIGDLEIVLPVVPHLVGVIRDEVKNWPIPVHLVNNDTDKYDAFAASRAALACSGTVSVELALAGLPMVIAYKVSAVTAYLYRRLIKTKFATLINIMQNREVVPEFLQENCTPEKLAGAAHLLLTNEGVRQKQIKELSAIAAWLGQGQFVPSEKAAEVVLQVVCDKIKS